MADQSFFQTVITGPIQVHFVDEGFRTVNAGNGTVLDAVMEAEMLLTGKGLFCNNRHDPPYEFISYNKDNRQLTVRRKRR
jgi:hypothetical protein